MKLEYSTLEGFTREDLPKLQHYNQALEHVSRDKHSQMKYEHDNEGHFLHYPKDHFHRTTIDVMENDVYEFIDNRNQLQFAAVLSGISAIILAIMVMANK